MTMMRKRVDVDDWASRGALALKACTLLTVVALVAVLSIRVPAAADDAGQAAATPPSELVATAPYHYLPSEYDIKSSAADVPEEPIAQF